MDLSKLGWSDYFQAFAREYDGQDYIIARVSCQLKKRYVVLWEGGEMEAVILGRFRYQAESMADFPVVGDWVLIKKEKGSEKAIIHHILPRKTKISRDTGTRKGRRHISDEQVIVANVDIIFLVAALNEELNYRRLERYLTLIWDSGAKPVLILNKADLIETHQQIVEDINDIALGVPIHVTSAHLNQNVDELKSYIKEGQTIALLGSSGVGKSTLINRIIGKEKFKVLDTSSDPSKGRHTTTHRELVVLEQGGILIDNPGMRSVQLWDGESGLSQSFEDIEQLAVHCRFNDCKHKTEPGCAVIEALTQGEVSQERYESYLKLQQELEYRERKENWRTRHNTKRRWKSITKEIRRMKKNK